jgi:hypothetical protein
VCVSVCRAVCVGTHTSGRERVVLSTGYGAANLPYLLRTVIMSDLYVYLYVHVCIRQICMICMYISMYMCVYVPYILYGAGTGLKTAAIVRSRMLFSPQCRLSYPRCLKAARAGSETLATALGGSLRRWTAVRQTGRHSSWACGTSGRPSLQRQRYDPTLHNITLRYDTTVRQNQTTMRLYHSRSCEGSGSITVSVSGSSSSCCSAPPLSPASFPWQGE